MYISTTGEPLSIIDRKIKRRAIKVDAVIKLDDYESILLMVKHDLGIGIVPEPYIAKRLLTEFWHSVTLSLIGSL